MPIPVVPDRNVPLPDDFEPADSASFQDKVKVAAATAKALLEAGAEIPVSDEDKQNAEDVFKEFTNVDTPPNTAMAKHLQVPATVAHLSVMLTEYDHQVVHDAVQLRRYVTNKLLEETALPDPRHRLKALELLGKISDVGLFTDKTEVTIKNSGAGDLESQIRSKLLKILENSKAVDASFEVLERELDPSLPTVDLDLDKNDWP